MIELSQETLTHFLCLSCQKWWTIGDWTPTDFLTCPHCGEVHQDFVDKTPAMLN